MIVQNHVILTNEQKRVKEMKTYLSFVFKKGPCPLFDFISRTMGEGSKKKAADVHYFHGKIHNPRARSPVFKGIFHWYLTGRSPLSSLKRLSKVYCVVADD